MERADVPSATYRIQLNAAFGFRAARAVVPYLHRLGISHLYCSPVTMARPGSTHGYDVVDPTRLNPELGSEEDFADLVDILHAHDMGMILDIVPNHMAASPDNPWWNDVLESGPNSPYAAFFDIEWHSPLSYSVPENRVLLPILGAPYGEVLENGDLRIEYDAGGLFARYYETRLPLALPSYARVLRAGLDQLRAQAEPGDPGLRELEEILTEIDLLPSSILDSLEQRRDLQQVRLRIKRRLDALATTHSMIADHIARAVATVNGTPGEAASFDILDQILSEQAYRLSDWKLARERINYRRFFDINDLVSLNVHLPDVFRETHQMIIDRLRRGQVDGLRIDHIDGLHDPIGYLEQLQHTASETEQGPTEDDPERDGTYVVVEKILAGDEELRDTWPVNGTTGYDFISVVEQISVNPARRPVIDRLYQAISGEQRTFTDVAYQSKIQVMRDLFPGNIRSLAVRLDKLAERHRYGRDITLEDLERAIIETTACLPIYRTYIRDFSVEEEDRRWILAAIAEARERRPEIGHALGFLRRVLLLAVPPYLPDEERNSWLDFTMRWQQITGPVMAKGFEDTALYVYNRLVSLNEVGGRPDVFGSEVAAFHAHNQHTREHWPHAMNASSTHDTKRSEDVRARIAVLSEIAPEWERRVQRWHQLNAGHRATVDGRVVPDGNTEYLIYQSLIGAWPFDETEIDAFHSRLRDYVLKAAREAKVYTSWVRPDERYEHGLTTFVDALFDDRASAPFMRDFRPFQQRVAGWGAVSSLARTLLKLTAPGVPDTYQGSDLWDLSLVDPDNRRPVDFARRDRTLARLELDDYPPTERRLADRLRNWTDGGVKLYVIAATLNFRRAHQELFKDGTYMPIVATGQRATNAVAFARVRADEWAITVAPRLVTDVYPDGWPERRTRWQRTALPIPEGGPTQFLNVLTGETIRVRRRGRAIRLGDLLDTFPIALLYGRADG